MFYPCRYWFTYQCVSWQDLLDLGEPCVKRIFGILQHESRNLKTSEGNICALHSGKLEPSTCSRFSNQRMERLIKSLNDPNLHLWNATVGLVLSVGVVTVRLGWQCLHLSLFLLQICLKSPLLIARYYQIFNQKNQQTAPLCLVEKKPLLPEQVLWRWVNLFPSSMARFCRWNQAAKVWRFYHGTCCPKNGAFSVIIHIFPGRLTAGTWEYIHPWKFGKSSEPMHHFQVRAVNLPGCIIYTTWKGSMVIATPMVYDKHPKNDSPPLGSGDRHRSFHHSALFWM